MSKDLHIEKELDQLDMLLSVVNVYGQIASLWMKKTRDSILHNRDFLEEMRQIFLTTFASYSSEVRKLSKKSNLKRSGNITFLAHNGQKVAVFLSSNSGLYGEIIGRTFNLFLEDVKANDLEAVIVGKHGQFLFTNEEPNRSYTYFEFPDEQFDQRQLFDLVRHLVQYEEIRIYYGKFVNFIEQEPTVFKLSANAYENLSEQEKAKKYIFEPNLETILMFFEKQIFTSMFEQTVRESQLAKFASLIMVMDRANDNIQGQLKQLKEKELRVVHRQTNQKQLNQFASMSLWRK